MLARRRSAVVRLGLSSTALTSVASSSSAKVNGTTWGRPSAPAVASRATRAAANRARASAPVMSLAVVLGDRRLPALERGLDVGAPARGQPVQHAREARLLAPL